MKLTFAGLARILQSNCTLALRIANSSTRLGFVHTGLSVEGLFVSFYIHLDQKRNRTEKGEQISILYVYIKATFSASISLSIHIQT